MSRPPWWAVLSSGAAPVVLIGGWTVAADRQGGGFDPVAQTISALAADYATDRWLMTAALAGLGICHVITAAGLRVAAGPGRVVLAVGGVATVLVAVFPQPVQGDSIPHLVFAGINFTALAVWPALAWRRAGGAALCGPGTSREPGTARRSRSRVPLALRPAVSVTAAVVLVGLLGWFAGTLGSDVVGLSERVLAGTQACWPLVVVLSWLPPR